MCEVTGPCHSFRNNLHDCEIPSRADIFITPQVITIDLTFLQENPPYNKGAFRIEVNFPAEYPFKPPKINFKTKIYHPNVDEKGQVSLICESVQI